MKHHCSGCGGLRTAVTRETLDERYPEVACADCKKRLPGIREDVFNRKRWQQQQDEMERQKLAKKGMGR